MASARKRFLEALRSDDWPGALEGLGEELSRGLVSQAVAALCSQEPITRWRAVEALGFLVSKLVEEDQEASRDVVRRLLWSLNEESGSVGWGAPEALAEILARDKGLAQEFLPIFTSFLKAGLLLRMPPAIAQGFLWGVFRLGELYGDILGKKEILQALASCLLWADPACRGLSALALKRLKALESIPVPASLFDDQGVFTFMDKGQLHTMSIAEVMKA